MDLGVVISKSPVAIFLQKDNKHLFNSFSLICKNYMTEWNGGRTIKGEKFIVGSILVYNVVNNVYKFMAGFEDSDIFTVEFEETVESIKRRSDRELIYLGRRIEG